LVELAMAMLIMGIVVSLAYTVIALAGNQLRTFRSMKAEVLDLSTFDQQLLRDFESCEIAFREPNGLRLQMNDFQQVSYHFTAERVERNDGLHLDTFSLHCSEPQWIFQGEVQHIPAGPVEEFRFNGMLSGTLTPFIYHKEYAARELMAFDAENLSAL